MRISTAHSGSSKALPIVIFVLITSRGQPPTPELKGFDADNADTYQIRLSAVYYRTRALLFSTASFPTSLLQVIDESIVFHRECSVSALKAIYPRR
jgi:hypothetical protein